MKNTLTFLLVILGISIGYSQDNNRPENTGDNFSLEGALAMFKNANSIEEFEKAINEENNNVNNLDLNNDGNIDYITVEDIKEGNTHVIVLSTFLDKTERQDIATIGIEKTGSQSAALQIEGDETLYAKNTIAEPLETNKTVVNVWFWPSVRYIYAPRYIVWVSPHRWGFYPRWWRPWRPIRHSLFYTHCAHHRAHYHYVKTRRVVVAHKVYAPRRHSSTLVVHNRRGTTVIHQNKRGNVKAVRVNKKNNVKRVKAKDTRR
jgi:hypothetical protein